MTPSRFPHPLSPIRIGPRRLRCRVPVTAREIRMAEGALAAREL